MNDSGPAYLEAIRASTGKNYSWLEIERLILRQWKAEFSRKPETIPAHLQAGELVTFPAPLAPVYLKGWSLHLYHYIRQLFPRNIITPELLRMIQAIEQTRFVEGRKIVNFIGHKNGGKTFCLACIPLALVTIEPEFSRAYISGPYKGSADAIIWGRMGTLWNQMRANSKGIDWLSHCRNEQSKDRYTVWPGSDESGFLELITLDKVGKLQGAKSANPDEGWLIVVCDEINQFPTRAFLDLLENIKGNRNLLVLTGCNFKNIEGMEGDLCRPEGREFSELNIEQDFDWLSAYSSHTWRFDGHRCSNIIAQRIIYSFLLDEAIRKESENDHGLNGPKYYEQIRSFPSSGMSDFFVLTRERVRAGGGYDDTEGYWEGQRPTRVVFCDPGFGGDPCKIGLFHFGNARVPTIDGAFVPGSIFEAILQFQTITLNVKLTATNEWISRLETVMQGRKLLIQPGQIVTLEQQIAVQAAEFCLAHQVPYSNFGFDGSMRAEIVREFMVIMGNECVPVEPGGGPSDRELPFQAGKTAKDEYFNFVTEGYFNFASLVQARQFRGGDLIPAAIAQICRRPWRWKGTRKQIQPKDEYKEDNQGRSPDDADVLVGGFEMALRRGFINVVTRQPDHATYAIDQATLLRRLMESPRFKKFGSAKLSA
jgi:hypothetical protein